jgi:hypothetical protein
LCSGSQSTNLTFANVATIDFGSGSRINEFLSPIYPQNPCAGL